MPFIDVPTVPGAARAAKARAQASANGGQPEARRWYEIRNAADANEAEVMIYDEVGGWFGVYADEFVSDLEQVTAPNLRVRLNSPGGSVFEGLAIANALRAHPSNVTVQVDGLAASIASVIAMAGDRVEMMPGSMMMIHDASGLCIGDTAEMQQMATVLDKISDNIAGAYAARAGGDPATWRDTMRAETWYLAEEAVDAGLADLAVPAAKTEPAEQTTARWDLAAYGYHGPKTEQPKPAPPKAKDNRAEPVEAPALVISIADILDEDTIAKLRAAVADRGAVAAAAEFGGTITAGRVPDIRAEAIPVHHTATVDEPWDGPAAVAAMPSDAATLRYCHAWQDSSSDDGTSESESDGDADDQKSSYKFPHHKTKGAPANLPACRDGLARLDNADIPDGDKTGVKAHLQAHLDDAAKNDDNDGGGADDAATTNEWASQIAHLTAPDDWTALTSHLTESSATGA